MDLKKERKATYAAASGGISASIGTYFNFPIWLLILTVLSATYLSVRYAKIVWILTPSLMGWCIFLHFKLHNDNK